MFWPFSLFKRKEAALPATPYEWHTVKASSFADPADLAAFRRCKKAGGSDKYCFGIGDNCVGFSALPVETDDTWVPVEDDGDNRIFTGDPAVPCCALPPEVWQPKWGSAKNAAGKRVVIRWNGKEAFGILGDTMPHLCNIKNGAGIDLNPGFAKLLGVKPPFMLHGVQWRWA